MITLNPIAKPKLYDTLQNDNIDITQMNLWKTFCKYEPKAIKRYELLTNLREVWKTRTLEQRKKFASAKNIDRAFFWDSTPQGTSYWMNWNDHLTQLKEEADD